MKADKNRLIATVLYNLAEAEHYLRALQSADTNADYSDELGQVKAIQLLLHGRVLRLMKGGN